MFPRSRWFCWNSIPKIINHITPGQGLSFCHLLSEIIDLLIARLGVFYELQVLQPLVGHQPIFHLLQGRVFPAVTFFELATKPFTIVIIIIILTKFNFPNSLELRNRKVLAIAESVVAGPAVPLARLPTFDGPLPVGVLEMVLAPVVEVDDVVWVEHHDAIALLAAVVLPSLVVSLDLHGDMIRVQSPLGKSLCERVRATVPEPPVLGDAEALFWLDFRRFLLVFELETVGRLLIFF